MVIASVSISEVVCVWRFSIELLYSYTGLRPTLLVVLAITLFFPAQLLLAQDSATTEVAIFSSSKRLGCRYIKNQRGRLLSIRKGKIREINYKQFRADRRRKIRKLRARIKNLTLHIKLENESTKALEQKTLRYENYKAQLLEAKLCRGKKAPTPTATPTPMGTGSPTPNATDTPQATPTPTSTATSTSTGTATPTPTDTGSPTPVGTGISLQVESTTTTGVAPHAVFFDMTKTTAQGIANPFMGVTYRTAFGDSSRHPAATGAVPAHVYEEPGAYIATMTALDGNGSIAQKQVNITVTDPNLVFSGSQTTCVCNVNDFNGCPAEAQQVVSNRFELAVLEQIKATNGGERYLLCRKNGTSGEFIQTQKVEALIIKHTTIIAAYGPISGHDELGNPANKPHIDVTSDLSFNLEGTGLKIHGLYFEGHGLNHNLTDASWTVDNFVFLGNEAWNFSSGYVVTHDVISWLRKHGSPNIQNHNRNVVAYNKLTKSYGGATVYTGGDQLALIGNIIGDVEPVGSHVLRIPHIFKGYLGHNILRNAGPTRTLLKLHGSVAADPGPTDTEYIVIEGNTFRENGPQGYWPVGIGPQNGAEDERVNHVLIDGNRFQFGSSTNQMLSLLGGLQHIRVSNNIFEDIQGGADIYMIRVMRFGPANRLNHAPIEIENNTAYLDQRNGGDSEVKWVLVDSDGVDPASGKVTVRNNILYTPKISGSMLADCQNPNLCMVTNNLVGVDPLFVAPPGNLGLKLNSPAKDQGTATPANIIDFDRAYRSRTYPDLGAFESLQ
ncbi:PKD domain-containing protein [Oligoflexia bacterium]|nr:PKD domain-containing protein [Oligoflexia bacterium]